MNCDAERRWSEGVGAKFGLDGSGQTKHKGLRSGKMQIAFENLKNSGAQIVQNHSSHLCS